MDLVAFASFVPLLDLPGIGTFLGSCFTTNGQMTFQKDALFGDYNFHFIEPVNGQLLTGMFWSFAGIPDPIHVTIVGSLDQMMSFIAVEDSGGGACNLRAVGYVLRRD